MNLLILSIPGIVLISLQLISILSSTIELPFDPIILWVAVTTVGLPCLLLALFRFLFKNFGWANSVEKEWVHTASMLVVLTFPSTMAFIALWVSYKPSDAELLVVLGLLNVGSIIYWGPALLMWSWLVSKTSKRV